MILRLDCNRIGVNLGCTSAVSQRRKPALGCMAFTSWSDRRDTEEREREREREREAKQEFSVSALTSGREGVQRRGRGVGDRERERGRGREREAAFLSQLREVFRRSAATVIL